MGCEIRNSIGLCRSLGLRCQATTNSNISKEKLSPPKGGKRESNNNNKIDEQNYGSMFGYGLSLG